MKDDFSVPNLYSYTWEPNIYPYLVISVLRDVDLICMYQPWAWIEHGPETVPDFEWCHPSLG